MGRFESGFTARLLRQPATPLALGAGLGLAGVFFEPIGGAAAAVTGGAISFWMSHLRLRRLRSTVDRQAAELDEIVSAGGFRDPETGLGTAETLRAEWDRQLARYQRRGERFALAVLTIEDRELPGPIPAAVAIGVAAELDALIRAEDQLYRLDNNVFGVLLTGSEREGAEYFFERVRKEMRVIDCGPLLEARPVAIQTSIIEWHDRPEGYGYTTTRGTRWIADGPVKEVPDRMIDRWAGQRASARRARLAQDPRDSQRHAS